jgi:Rps23 Pro-64 3,4-dihydroxylase Tpa1-like proline 4-hydroxylase
MRAKQILDAFSETLMQDERILSPQERDLLTSLLHNSKALSSSTPEIQSAVSAAIARSVGETVAQRAFALLGGSIVDQILARSGISARTDETAYPTGIEMKSPQPPNPGPFPPSPSPGPGNSPDAVPIPSPQPPNISSATVTKWRSSSLPVQHVTQGATQSEGGQCGVAVLDKPEFSRAQCVILDEFLAPQELEELTGFVIEHESDFENSAVISPTGQLGVNDYTHRRSRVLMDLGKYQDVILNRIQGVLPAVLDELGMKEFPIAHVEAQITASNDGDFFGAHTDDSGEVIASRHLTFVYFFHREPCPFEGGELHLHDAHPSRQQRSTAGSYQSIAPRQNQIVFFPCSVLHEITPVKCSSNAFADSRFTLNGWLHK